MDAEISRETRQINIKSNPKRRRNFYKLSIPLFFLVSKLVLFFSSFFWPHSSLFLFFIINISSLYAETRQIGRHMPGPSPRNRAPFSYIHAGHARTARDFYTLLISLYCASNPTLLRANRKSLVYLSSFYIFISRI